MTTQEFNQKYQELYTKMNNVKTNASKNKYAKLMLALSNEYRLHNGLKTIG